MDMINMLNSLEPWMIPIIVMVCVTLIVAIATAGDIITAKIKQNSRADLSENKEFLNALREFKEQMEHRVSNLEAIAGDSGNRNKGQDKKTIDMDFEEQQDDDEQFQAGKLQNMLNR